MEFGYVSGDGEAFQRVGALDLGPKEAQAVQASDRAEASAGRGASMRRQGVVGTGEGGGVCAGLR